MSTEPEPTVRNIITAYLDAHPEYDGLCNTYCGCFRDDPLVCWNVSPRCQCGHRETDEDGQPVIVPGPARQRRARVHAIPGASHRVESAKP